MKWSSAYITTDQIYLLLYQVLLKIAEPSKLKLLNQFFVNIHHQLFLFFLKGEIMIHKKKKDDSREN